MEQLKERHDEPRAHVNVNALADLPLDAQRGAAVGFPYTQEKQQRGTVLENVLPALRAGRKIGRLGNPQVGLVMLKNTRLEYVAADNNIGAVQIGDQVVLQCGNKYHTISLDSLDLTANDWFVLPE